MTESDAELWFKIEHRFKKMRNNNPYVTYLGKPDYIREFKVFPDRLASEEGDEVVEFIINSFIPKSEGSSNGSFLGYPAMRKGFREYQAYKEDGFGFQFYFEIVITENTFQSLKEDAYNADDSYDEDDYDD